MFCHKMFLLIFIPALSLKLFVINCAFECQSLSLRIKGLKENQNYLEINKSEDFPSTTSTKK